MVVKTKIMSAFCIVYFCLYLYKTLDWSSNKVCNYLDLIIYILPVANFL